MNMFSTVQLVCGLYLIWCTITGTGKVYENEYLKVPVEQYRKTMRILCGVTGVVISISAGLELLGIVGQASTWGWILWALGLIPLLVLAIYTAKCTDRKAAKAANGQAARQPVHKGEDPLRAAFVFDEDETVQPEETAAQQKEATD